MPSSGTRSGGSPRWQRTRPRTRTESCWQTCASWKSR
ncbi:hypothetical protein VHUM_01358 [Vanrija humicola]|uniref:Uncharacterized protein n=1 Tax=Vanrija humicola TaxID=5417 RepID=A0A7D8ZUL2_VANHU|nr:hypothetical protein VHUM_01358 [Vanrija humicola]